MTRTPEEPEEGVGGICRSLCEEEGNFKSGGGGTGFSQGGRLKRPRSHTHRENKKTLTSLNEG